MRNVHEVLKQKEADCARLRHEIEALRIVVPLLDEEGAASPVALPEERERTEAEVHALQGQEYRETEPVTSPEIDVDRKGPLSSGLRESSWWKRQGNR